MTNLCKSYQELRYEKHDTKHNHTVERVAFVIVLNILDRKPTVDHSPQALHTILLR